MQISDVTISPIVDRKKFEEFCAMFSMDTVALLIEKVPTNMQERLDAIYKNIEAGDTDGVQREFHTIKGAAAQLYGNRLAEEASKLEKISHDFDAVKEQLPQFEQILFETIKWWMDHIKK